MMQVETQGVIAGHLIPKGFVFDGASIPRVLWSLLGGPFHPRVIDASCVHDKLYSEKKLPRGACDRVFRNVLKENEHKCTTLMYWGVKLFGGLYYR